MENTEEPAKLSNLITSQANSVISTLRKYLQYNLAYLFSSYFKNHLKMLCVGQVG